MTWTYLEGDQIVCGDRPVTEKCQGSTLFDSVWKASEAVLASDCIKWAKRHTPNAEVYKTTQPLSLESFELSQTQLQIYGMIVGGFVCLPRGLEPRTDPKPKAMSVQRRLAVQAPGSSTQLWPTPVASERSGTNPNTGSGHGLSKTVRLLEMGLPLKTPMDIYKREYQIQKPGKLNPTFVEWLMGVPTGWTELKPWAVEWYR